MTIAQSPSSAARSPATPNRRRRALRWSIAAAVIAALLGLWLILLNNGILDAFHPRKFRVVVPDKIYASGQIHRRIIRDVLAQYHIATIVSLTDPVEDDRDDAAEVQAAKEMGIVHYRFVLDGDGTGDIHRYADALQQMVIADQTGRPLLIHCHSGVQRSGAATAFYRILVQHWNGPDTVAELERNHWNPSQNPKMLPYLNSHLAELARLLVDRHVIPAMPTTFPTLVP